MTSQARRCGLLVLAALAVGAAIGFVAGYPARVAWDAGPAEPQPPAAAPPSPTPARVPREQPRPDTPPPEGPLPARVDILEAAIEVNRILEPELDEGALREAVAAITSQARGQLAKAATAEQKVAALNRVLLADREVSYLSNIYWRDASLAAALLRRKGNCLATTTLYVVVGRRLGLPVHGVLVPQHALARFGLKRPRNIETTAGGKDCQESHYRTTRGYGDAEAGDFGFGKALSDDQFAAVLLAMGARQLLARGQHAAALRLIERAGKLWPGSLYVAFERADALYQTPGRREEALSFYRGVLSPSQKRSPLARARAAIDLARHVHALGRQGEALSYLRFAYALAPKPQQTMVLDAMSSCYRTRRDFSAAALAQELALVLNPNADALYGLAIMYKNAGHLDDAIRALRQSLKMNPESWHTRLVLAGYLIRAGQAEEGWRVFRTVQKPRGNHDAYHTNMAWFYASAGKKREFLDHLDKALALSTTPRILSYIRTEVDFDRYRDAPDFKALIEKHRRRLSGEKP